MNKLLLVLIALAMSACANKNCQWGDVCNKGFHSSTESCPICFSK